MGRPADAGVRAMQRHAAVLCRQLLSALVPHSWLLNPLRCWYLVSLVPQAIERVNDLDPEILEEQQELFFHLQQQRLIELIRGGQLAEALEFAQVGGSGIGTRECRSAGWGGMRDVPLLARARWTSVQGPRCLQEQLLARSMTACR